MKLEWLVRGLPGHPLHPPLTDLTIGTYGFATIAAIGAEVGISETNATHGWWIALIVGLCTTAFTATTGFIDWIGIEWGSELWKTATAHMCAMLAATGFFLGAAFAGHEGYKAGAVNTSGFALTIAGFLLLTVGGWLGGTVTFVYGMRVLNLVQEPYERAIPPEPQPEKEAAEGG
jgi:uncharacterized membrane protein